MFNPISRPRGGLSRPSIPHIVVFVLLAALIVPSAALASHNGSVRGKVIDPAGEALGFARVALRDATGRAVHQARANAEGEFRFERVAAGRYELTADAAGFRQSSRQPIIVNGEAVSADIRMEVAAIEDHMLVSATRTETPVDRLSGAATVATSEEIERRAQSLLSESLRAVPGAIVAQSGGRGAITTLFVRGGETDYNKVLIDGVPVNAAGGLYDFAFLTPENIERVEVVRGPRSALFGSDAMTSVVQLVSHRGLTERPEFELVAEGGNLDFYRQAARLSGVAGRFDYAGSFGFQHTDGRFENSDFINRSASANLGFRLSSEADLRLTSRYNNATSGVAGPTASLFADPDQRQKHRDIAVAAAFDWRVSSRFHQTARFIFSEFDTHSFDPLAQDLLNPNVPPLPPGSFGTDFAFSFIEHQRRTGVQYQAVAALSNAVVLTGGVDFDREAGVFTDDFSRVSPERDNLGLYGQAQASWRERLFVTAGLRVERNTSDVPADLRATLEALGSTVPSGNVGYGTEVNPRLAAAFYARRHNEGAWGATVLRASYGTGIKAPWLTEAFSPNAFFLGNPALDPERTRSFDIGLAQEFFNRRASFEATYFDNRFRDQIIFVSDPLNFGPIRLPDGRLTHFINQERSSARGVELTGAARPVRRLRLGASYTYLRSRIEESAAGFSSEEGLPLLRRPRHSGWFEVAWVDERFDLSLDGTLIGERRDIDPVNGARFNLSGRPFLNSGYARLNGAGNWRWNRWVTLFARAENLLNREYEEVLGFPAYKFNVTAGVRLRLGGGR